MDFAMIIEIFGYIGSVLVVVSMLMSSVVKLRVINTVGSIVSGIYALIVGALPLVLMNACLIIINLYNLFKLLKTQKEYDIVKAKADDSSAEYFINRYARDIKSYFPDYKENKAACDTVYFVYCNGTPAGLLLGKELENGIVDVVMDYTTPAYRDCTAGEFLYSKLPENGVKMLKYSQKESKTHVEYMTKMGFVKENGVYIKTLA
ncbi:MAG: YgjV family protein [Firmicutes bacterium]|nr:YgjV family protein [Bacillota bacterium]